jgi:hypothetical protein
MSRGKIDGLLLRMDFPSQSVLFWGALGDRSRPLTDHERAAVTIR